VYDEQKSRTQGYGVGIALYGQTAGFTKISIIRNDFRGEVTRPILSRATGVAQLVIHGNRPAEVNASH
jgi:hypothetical protein